MELLFRRPFVIENPFFWMTRTDVIEGLRAAGHADLAAASVSCVHTWQASTDQPHCGTCSQCVDRRLAALAARLTDREDPSIRYQVQLLTGHLEDVLEQTMVERIVGTAREVEAIETPVQFLQKFGEVSRLLRQLPGRADEVAIRLFELHRRHVRQINGALDHEIAAISREGFSEALPPTCLLQMLAGPRAGASAAAASSDAHSLSSTTHVPTKEDWHIVRALADAPHTLILNDLRERLNPKLSRRTLGKRLSMLQPFRLVHYPNGARKGVALAKAGRKLLGLPPDGSA